MTNLPLAVLRFLLVVPAIILHEVSHGWVAYMLGDPTAKERGRLTLNPIPHIDIWGTVILPILMVLTTGFAFGYAKPVPVNPYLLRKSGVQNGMLLVGVAGPTTNVLLAIVAAIVGRILFALGSLPNIVLWMVAWFAYINLVLAFFNLIPIPPLDGSRVVQRFLSGRALEVYNSIEPYGFVIVLLLIFALPALGFDALNAYFSVTLDPAVRFLLGPLLAVLH